MQMLPCDDASTFVGQAAWEDAASTAMFVPLMGLLERFSDHCFRHRLTFWVDSGTLLGVVRHRAVIPWDYDADLGVSTDTYRQLIRDFGEQPGMRLDFETYGEGDSVCAILPPGPLADPSPLLDVVRFADDGRNFMTEALQKRWPLDMWRTQHTDRSWCYDLFPEEQGELVGLPSWCGLFRAPVGWPRRLDRHYDGWHARPEALARAARHLPFDPLEPAVRLAAEYPSLEAGLRGTRGRRPFVVRGASPVEGQALRKDEALAQPFRPTPAGAPTAQRLATGERFHWLVSERDATTAELAGRTMTEVVTGDDFRLWGRVEVVHQRAGDAVILPPSWSHRMYTYGEATGVAGVVS